MVSPGYWTGFAEAAIRLRDVGAAAEIYEGMLRYRGQHNYPSAGSFGSVDRHLGRLAALLGRLDLAEAHLAVADAMHSRLRAPLHRALTLVARAELIATTDPSDRQILRLADEAIGLAREHGAPRRRARGARGTRADRQPLVSGPTRRGDGRTGPTG